MYMQLVCFWSIKTEPCYAVLNKLGQALVYSNRDGNSRISFTGRQATDAPVAHGTLKNTFG